MDVQRPEIQDSLGLKGGLGFKIALGEGMLLLPAHDYTALHIRAGGRALTWAGMLSRQSFIRF